MPLGKLPAATTFASGSTNGRIYDATNARFLQADPLIQDPTNSQSLNRYSYVWNNPLNAVDPSGYMTLGDLFGSWGLDLDRMVQNTNDYFDNLDSMSSFFGSSLMANSMHSANMARLMGSDNLNSFHADVHSLGNGQYVYSYVGVFRGVRQPSRRTQVASAGGCGNSYNSSYVNCNYDPVFGDMTEEEWKELSFEEEDAFWMKRGLEEALMIGEVMVEVTPEAALTVASGGFGRGIAGLWGRFVNWLGWGAKAGKNCWRSTESSSIF